MLLGRIHMFCPIWHVQYALWLALMDCMLMYGIHCNGFPRPPAQLTSSRRAVAPGALDVGGRLTVGIVQPANYVQRCRLFSDASAPTPRSPGGRANGSALALGTARVVCSALRTPHVNIIKLYMYKNV